MEYALAGIRAWTSMMGLPALLVAAATPTLLAVDSFLPPNLFWLCYLIPVVLAAVRCGFSGAAAVIEYVPVVRFSCQWRTSLTTITGAASVLLMRAESRTSRLERDLLSDISDEAMHLGRLLTDASFVSCAVVRDTRSGPHR